MLKCIRIANIGKFAKKKDVQAQVAAANVEGLVSVTKNFTAKEAFLEFDSQESQEKALAAIKAMYPKWEMRGVPAKKRQPDFNAKRFEDENEETKRLRESRTIVDVVTPLAQYVYVVFYKNYILILIICFHLFISSI